MAFDFGAALSSVGQIAPAMSEGAEIRRQRLADAARVSQQAQAAQDEHAARLAQIEREKQLTSLEAQNAKKMTPLGEPIYDARDRKYYRVFLTPDNQLKRLPIEGYDPEAEKAQNLQRANDLITKFGIDPKSEFAEQVRAQALGVKLPLSGIPRQVISPDGTVTVYDPRNPTGGAAPVLDAEGKPLIAKTPPISTTSTSEYHWVDNAGNVHATPTTRTTTKHFGAPLAPGQPSTVAPVVPRTSSRVVSPARPTGLIGSDRIVGTGKLPAAAEKVIITTQPVIDQTNALIKQIESLGLANNNQPGYLAKDYIAYRFGHASPDGTLGSQIAALSLGSVVDAASALQGSSRSITALKKAMEHTPNPLVDSPKLLHEKLLNINSRLNDMVNEARSGGQGQSVSQSPSAWEDNAVSVDGKIRLGLRNGKWYNKATGKEYKP